MAMAGELKRGRRDRQQRDPSHRDGDREPQPRSSCGRRLGSRRSCRVSRRRALLARGWRGVRCWLVMEAAGVATSSAVGRVLGSREAAAVALRAGSRPGRSCSLMGRRWVAAPSTERAVRRRGQVRTITLLATKRRRADDRHGLLDDHEPTLTAPRAEHGVVVGKGVATGCAERARRRLLTWARLAGGGGRNRCLCGNGSRPGSGYRW